jgi:tRNA dimethylallyltransferase
LAWGTGLYIDSIIYDFKVEGTSSNSELRSELEKLSSEVLHKKLEAIDPEYAAELHKNNRQYVVRALEYHAVTWKSKREDREEKKLQYDVLFLSPDYGTREDLYKRINTRVGQMFEEWLEAEVNWLINHWYGEDSFGMKSIGYSEFFPYIRWEYDLDHCKELVQQHSRNYAKRQLTWFKKYEQHF